ncbi:hypothetical protein CDD83_3960 [Cordyceps sp. RAO-2017]|nr:hypothetical protein CDD83_3960 [Cordyceps sp. RAO-2017]
MLVTLVLAAAATALAAPAKQAACSDGIMTYYEPGLGACEQTNNGDEPVVAVSALLFDEQRPCGRRIRINYHGRTAEVGVVDRCTGCARNDLDVSPAVFTKLAGSLDAGRLPISWEWI